jgi:glycosyltransferase involved in cell wall biosynthesis
VIQLLREWPPGYGGVERVAHELALLFKTQVFSLDIKSKESAVQIPVEPCPYELTAIPGWLIGRVRIPFPGKVIHAILLSKRPLIAHLPAPEILVIAAIAKLITPNRKIVLYWHAILDKHQSSFFQRALLSIYQAAAVWLGLLSSAIIVTSPVLRINLAKMGINREKIYILPCCISKDFEASALAITRKPKSVNSLRIIYIGRLSSYKRVDLLLDQVEIANKNHAQSQSPGDHLLSINIVGDGSNMKILVNKAAKFNTNILFSGLLDEQSKLHALTQADLLILPSLSSNEAFGIVQLEAMASGIPALAFKHPQSGMSWVCDIDSLQWSGTAKELPCILRKIATNNLLYNEMCVQSRDRYLQLFKRDLWSKEASRILADYQSF